MYQQTLKLYKGIDNIIEFEVKNADQRKTPVVGFVVMVKFFDAIRKNLFTVQGTAIPGKTGIMTVVVPKEKLDNLDPQKLSMAAFLVDANGAEHILYADSQFGVLGAVEVFDGYNGKYATNDVIVTVDTFNYDMGSKTYISEIAEFGVSINDNYRDTVAAVDSILIDVHNNQHEVFEGRVKVQASKQQSNAIGNVWDTIATIDLGIFDGSTLVTSERVYNTSDGTETGLPQDYKYVRFTYPKAETGANAVFDVTRSVGSYVVEIKNGGSGYNIGDLIKVPGSELDGVNGANDLIIKVVAIDSNVRAVKTVSAVTVEGVAVQGTGIYYSRRGSNYTGLLDKIIIRR